MANHITCDKCDEETSLRSWRLELHKRGPFLESFEGKDLCVTCGRLLLKALAEAGFELTEVLPVAVFT